MQAANPGVPTPPGRSQPSDAGRGAIHPKTLLKFAIGPLSNSPCGTGRPTAETFNIAQHHRRTQSAEQLQLPPAGTGTHYKDLTAAQRHSVVIGALRIARTWQAGTAVTRWPVLAALVHEFGSEVALFWQHRPTGTGQ